MLSRTLTLSRFNPDAVVSEGKEGSQALERTSATG